MPCLIRKTHSWMLKCQQQHHVAFNLLQSEIKSLQCYYQTAMALSSTHICTRYRQILNVPRLKKVWQEVSYWCIGAFLFSTCSYRGCCVSEDKYSASLSINVLTWLNHTQHMTVNISETHVQVSYIQKDKHLITNLSQKSQHINKLSKAVRHRLYRRLTCHPVSSLSACAWAHEGLGAPS